MPQNVTSELAEKSFEGHMKRVFDIIILKLSQVIIWQ